MSESLLRVSSLNMMFGGVVVADDIDLALGSGEMQALIGPNGAGKSTFVNLVSGFLRAASGTIELGGDDITRWSAAKRRLAGIARTFQTPRVLPEATVAGNVLVALRAGRPSWRLAVTHRTTEEERTAVREALALVGLEDRADILASNVTYEERRFIDIAAALAKEPRVLFLDEPTCGMSSTGTEQLEALIRSLRGRVAMVVIDHDMSFIRRLDAPVAVLHRGAVVRRGTIGELERDDFIREIYLGTVEDE